MSPPIARSYADAARVPGRPSEENTSAQTTRRGSVMIEEPIRDTSRDLMRSQNTVSPPVSRRPSIAEVLGRRLSRSSQASGLTNSPSSSYHLPAVQEQEGKPSTRVSRKRRRGRPKHRRRKSSKTRDHGDFSAYIAQPSLVAPNNVQEKTALEAAITDGDAELVVELLSDESNLGDTSSKPLQTAALEGDEAIVNLLLESNNFEIDARDLRDRTAVYCATSRGHDSIVEILLEHGAKPLSHEEQKIAKQELAKWRIYEAQIKQHDHSACQQEHTFERGAVLTSEPEENSGEDLRPTQSPPESPTRSDSVDHLYRLMVGSAETIKEKVEEANDERQAAQQRGEWVKGPLPNLVLPNPQKEIGTTQKHVRFPGFGFEIPVVEFDFSSNGGHRIVSPTPSVDELLYGARGVETITKGSGPASQDTCRWYHIPANHLGWAEDLIRRIYKRRSKEEQSKRDVILSREPFKAVDQDHTNPVSLEPRPQSRALRAFCRDMTLDREGTTRLSTAFNLIIPFVHWETEDSRAEMSHVMETVRKGRKNDLDNLYHPVPSPRSIPDLKAIQGHSDWCKNEKMLCAYLYNQPPVHPRRTLDQFYYHMLEDTKERDQDQVITRYYHNVWKRNQHSPVDEEEFKFAMSTTDEPEFPFRLDNVADEVPVLEHLDDFRKSHDTQNRPPPPTADSELSRQDSSAPSREVKEPRFVMMVDQLWMWILDDKTIITSFPQNWSRDDKTPISNEDSGDVLSSIYKFFSLVNRPPLESVYDLAQLIVYKSLETFCKKRTPYGVMQILDVYESAIAQVTDRESKVFNKFAAKSKKKRSQHQDADSPNDSEELYNIDEEIELLKEVKDIQDELHILYVLLDTQSGVLEQADETMKKREFTQDVTPKSPLSYAGTIGSSKAGQEAPYRSTFHFKKLQQMVLDQEKRRKTLQVQAEAANKALNHLLDLKQKQANVSEARSARWTAESTKQQGNIMVLFTLVTIIFAPLSLIVTIFGLRVVEFPVDLHLGFVFEWMFGISLAVIFPMILLVIYTTRNSIKKVIMRIKARIFNWKWFHELHSNRQKKVAQRQREEKDGDYASSSGFTDEKELAERRVPFWRRQVEVVGLSEVVVDTEKGVGVNGKSVG